MSPSDRVPKPLSVGVPPAAKRANTDLGGAGGGLSNDMGDNFAKSGSSSRSLSVNRSMRADAAGVDQNASSRLSGSGDGDRDGLGIGLEADFGFKTGLGSFDLRMASFCAW